MTPVRLAGAALLVAFTGGPPAEGEMPRSFRDCSNCPQMVVIPAGRFDMGSPDVELGHTFVEAPRHAVAIRHAFAVSRYEITFDDWKLCVAEHGCGAALPGDEGWGRRSRPVINVNWDDAQLYVKWLSGKAGQAYRLLSESEWEYAARAGAQTAYASGMAITTRESNFGNNHRARTLPVGTFAANAFGLFDMSGNAAEWVQDCLNADYKGAPVDGTARMSGDCDEHLVRGGSWASEAWLLRSAARFGVYHTLRTSYVGLRVARAYEH